MSYYIVGIIAIFVIAAAEVKQNKVKL